MENCHQVDFAIFKNGEISVIFDQWLSYIYYLTILLIIIFGYSDSCVLSFSPYFSILDFSSGPSK